LGAQPRPQVDVAVELLIADNTAYTVASALRALGYRTLLEVRRAETLRLTLGADAPPVEAVVRMLSRAEVVFNPNKHRLSYSVYDSTEPREETRAVIWEARVRDLEDETTALTRLLRTRFGIARLEGIERAVAWRLYDDGGAAPKQRLEWACDALLCNRFCQTATIGQQPQRRPFPA